MIVYRFNPVTMEYVGEKPAHINPLETKKQGKEVYLLPSHCTYNEPPKVSENEAAVFDVETEKWSIVEDHRGLEGYLNGTKYTIENLGPLPEGFTLEALEIPIDRKAQIIDELNSIDTKGARASRAIALAVAINETPNSEDVETLKSLEKQAKELREELATL